MGAEEFYTEAGGHSAKAAFAAAQEDARYEYGHGGYTGSIAEKSSFRLVEPNMAETPAECIERHIRAETFDDKWGPAGCVKLADHRWAFWGWASS
jgi:hypothetical protein